MSSFIVRVARPSDYQSLADLLAELLGYSNSGYSDSNTSDASNNESLTTELANALNTNLLRLLSTPGTTLLVAQEEGQDNESTGVIGFVSLYSYWGLLDDSPSALLDRVVVAKRYQASSVVAALLEQAVGACQAMGCSQVQFIAAEGSLVPTDVLGKMGFEEKENCHFLEIR